MNRTQRAMIKSCRTAIDSDRRQINKTVADVRELAGEAKAARGWDRKNKDRDIQHLSDCLKRDRRDRKAISDDIKLYKQRWAAARKTTKELLA